jgi:hypothetical protein
LKRGCKVTTIDIKKGATIRWNLEKGLPPSIKNKKFDYVVAGEILEHIVSLDRLLRDISLVTDTIISYLFQIFLSLRNRLFALFEKDLVYSSFPSEDENRHVNDFSIFRLKCFLKKYNFRIVKILTNGIVFGRFIFHAFLPSLGDILIVKAKK